tara:strand:+ start:3055 stop:3228 length:174 start_codon:yes stop_codon:yes gene_type:complete
MHETLQYKRFVGTSGKKPCFSSIDVVPAKTCTPRVHPCNIAALFSREFYLYPDGFRT